MFRVYLVTDGNASRSRDLCAAVRSALAVLPPGSAAVQLREPQLAPRELFRQASALLPLCSDRAAPLLINDRADIALATGAAGVHLPASGLPPAEARRLLGPRALVGVSCHSAAEVRDAAAAAADFAVFGPVWPTPGKGEPAGVEALRAAAGASALPVFALGGVDPTNAAEAVRAGAAGVACIRAVLGAADPAAAARRLWAALEAA